MNTESMHSTPRTGWPGAAIAIFGLLAAGPSWSQVPVDEDGNPIGAEVAEEAQEPEAAAEAAEAPAAGNLTAAELEKLVGPIALYPDDLLAVVLPASAYPLQIVQAARFLAAHAEDESVEPDESWDDSVVALLNYPQVIEMMNDDLEWTYALGEAVVGQQDDVIAAIEAFRDRAYAAGNLDTDEHQTVTRENGVIEIEPAEEDVIYVPYYEPERVVVYQPEPVYHYYTRPSPVYYYPYPYGYSFASGYFWGVTTAFHIGWATDHLRVFHHSYWGHPYFGHTYFFGRWWYRRPSISVHNTFYVNHHVRRPPHHERNGDFWRPRRHSGGILERRAVRESYYTNRRGRAGPGYRHTQRVVGDGARVERQGLASRVRENRDAERNAHFSRNRSDAAQRDRERTRDPVAERRRATDAASDRPAIRFRQREDLARRVTDGNGIRFRTRERAEPEHRSSEQSSSRRAAPNPALRERQSFRHPSETARRVGSPSRSFERARSSRPSADFSRAAPRTSRPSSVSRSSPRISPPSSGSRSSPRISRPSSGSHSSSPRVSRPSRAAPTSHSAPRRSHRR